MKQVPIFIALLLICFTGIGQAGKNKLRVGAGLNMAIPVYNLDISSPGGGADVIVYYGLSGKSNITADAAFIGLPGKGSYPSTGLIPIRLGVRYFPVPKLYAGAKAGLGIYTILKASASHLAYSFNGGYIITKKLEAGILYDGYTNDKSSFGYLGIRVGYNF